VGNGDKNVVIAFARFKPRAVQVEVSMYQIKRPPGTLAYAALPFRGIACSYRIVIPPPPPLAPIVTHARSQKIPF
jgi:hypothetical protein